MLVIYIPFPEKKEYKFFMENGNYLALGVGWWGLILDLAEASSRS